MREPTWFPAASSHLIERQILALPTAVVRADVAATASCGVGGGLSVSGLAQPARTPAANALTTTMRRSVRDAPQWAQCSPDMPSCSFGLYPAQPDLLVSVRQQWSSGTGRAGAEQRARFSAPTAYGHGGAGTSARPGVR